MLDAKPVPERRVIEQALRDAGLSRRHAKRLLSGGWAALVGDQRAEVDELKADLQQLRESVLDDKI